MTRPRSVLFSLAFCLTGAAFAQEPPPKNDLMLFGIVDDQKSNDVMQNVCVRVFTDSIAGDSVFTDAMGKYQVFVPLGKKHRLAFTAEGHHRKVVEIDATAEMEVADRVKEWNIRIDISLQPADVQLPDELLDTPIGMASWEAALHEFQWDQPYTERYKQRYKQAVKEAGKK